MKLRQLLLNLKISFPNTRISLWSKNNYLISEALIDCHLETSLRELNKKVFYWGLGRYDNEIIVVINKKVRVR